MSMSGPHFYDDDNVFTIYTEHRQSPTNPNDTLEQPIIEQLLGSVAGLRVLDLGCGDARFGRQLLEQGVARYVGIDGSHNMIAAARQTLHGMSGEVVQHTIEDWVYPDRAFDCVVSRLAFHYVSDFASLCSSLYATLVPGGRLIFSVEHPVITSCDRGWTSGTLRQDWIVDNYFEVGLRETQWLGATVQKYHRTVENYFGTLQQAGFVIEQLRESTPQRENFPDQATYQRRKGIPLFLFFAARKPA
jgi:SAM-dependent methyltransferase